MPVKKKAERTARRATSRAIRKTLAHPAHKKTEKRHARKRGPD
jgi:hypothetical protein